MYLLFGWFVIVFNGFKQISGLFLFDHFLSVYYNERQGFGAEAPKPRRIKEN